MRHTLVASVMLLITIWFLWAGRHSAASGTSIKFVETPGDRYYVYNATVVELKWKFEVIGSSIAPFRVEWFANISGVSKTIARLALPHLVVFLPTRFDGRLTINKPSTLVISNFTKEDLTSYSIRVLHTDVSPFPVDTTTLIAAEPPYEIYTNVSDAVTVKEKTMLSVLCTAKGLPTPTVTWKYKGNTILVSTNESGSALLSVEDISRDRRGYYLCEARNFVGSNVTTVLVDVTYFGLTCMVKVNTSGVYFTTTTAANPSIQLCEPYACNDEKRLNILPKRNITVYQFAKNSVDSGYCNRTISIERKFKCKSSPKEFPYTFVSTDTHGENVTTWFVETTLGIITVNDSALLMRLKDKLFTGDEEYNPEKDNDKKTNQLFEKLCSGVSGLGISVSSVLIQTFLLAAIFIMNDGH